MTDTNIQLAAYQWVTDTAAAMAEYGDIRLWDVSGVTNMDNLFGSDNPQNWIRPWTGLVVTIRPNIYLDGIRTLMLIYPSGIQVVLRPW